MNLEPNYSMGLKEDEDGNKTNNHVSNLRWVTGSENMNSWMPFLKNNTSGFKNITFEPKKKTPVRFNKIIYGKTINRYFNTLNEALWFKFVYIIQNR